MQNKEFQKRNRDFVKSMKRDSHLRKLSHEWFDSVFNYEYSYHFTWLGRPVIQFPQDIVAIQEIIWKVKPDLIIVFKNINITTTKFCLLCNLILVSSIK